MISVSFLGFLFGGMCFFVEFRIAVVERHIVLLREKTVLKKLF